MTRARHDRPRQRHHRLAPARERPRQSATTRQAHSVDARLPARQAGGGHADGAAAGAAFVRCLGSVTLPAPPTPNGRQCHFTSPGNIGAILPQVPCPFGFPRLLTAFEIDGIPIVVSSLDYGTRGLPGQENVRNRGWLQAAAGNPGLILRRLTAIGGPRPLQGQALALTCGPVPRSPDPWPRVKRLSWPAPAAGSLAGPDVRTGDVQGKTTAPAHEPGLRGVSRGNGRDPPTR